MRTTWYTACSLDGRIAGPGDDMSLLEAIDADPREADDFPQFLATVDAILVGSGTLRWLHDQGLELPHEGLPVWLLSHDEQLAQRAAAADPGHTPVTRVEGDVRAVLDGIRAAGCEHLWVCGGGDVAGQVLAADGIDEIILTMAPVALGAGPALFELPDGGGARLRHFQLVECRQYGRGSVRLHWTRVDAGEDQQWR